jgi:putative FmdB family regulatory protein
MPLYDYACTKCGHTLEVRHGFDETYAQPCAQCGAPVRRVFNPAPILFKGSGFYVNDSRKPAASKAAEKPAEPAKTESPSSPAAKTESKPSDSAA